MLVIHNQAHVDRIAELEAHKAQLEAETGRIEGYFRLIRYLNRQLTELESRNYRYGTTKVVRPQIIPEDLAIILEQIKELT